MSWRLRRLYTLAGITSIFGLIIFAVDTGTPALMNHLTILEAEKLSVHWLTSLSKELELPGQPPSLEAHSHLVIDKFFSPTHEEHQKASFKHLLTPNSYEAGHHLHEVIGYAICTLQKDCIISGGAPIESDLRLPEVLRTFDKVLKNNRIEAIFSGGAADNGDRVVSVMVPLLRDKKTQAVAIVDLQRSDFERSLYEGIQRAGTVLASVISLISLGIVLILFYLDNKRKSAETEVSYLALHDGLTGLPNRRHFNAVIEEWLENAAEKSDRLAVLCVDVDNFKDVNDIFGHPVGDQLLIGIGQNLKLAAGARAFVARLSGDEFAILLRRLDQDTDIATIGNTILEAQQKPISIDGEEISASVSIGIAEYPLDGDNTEELMKHADLALYRAKANGRACLNRFTQELDIELRRKRRLQNDLQVALMKNQLEMHYQPQVDTSTETLTGFEALIRWTHETDGPISPSEFIPIAEQSELIEEIGYWTLNTACREAANWPDDYTVAVNLSPMMFSDDNLVQRIQNILTDTRLPPHRLEVEITENLLLGNTDGINKRLIALRGLGVGIAMDDFGTGYSSLSYLTRVPVTKIKIDQSFIRELSDSANVDSIIHAIVGIGKSLGVTVIAEGVETVDQLQRLQVAGCDAIQGFLYGKPSPNPFADSNNGHHSRAVTVQPIPPQ